MGLARTGRFYLVSVLVSHGQISHKEVQMKRIIGWILIACSAWTLFVIRFSQIDATEARLFLDNWPKMLICFAAAILGAVLMGEK